jgi:hypothetical protein
MSKEWKIMQCQRECKKKGYIPKEEKGRPRMRWLDDVESDLKKKKVKGRKEGRR